MDKKKLILLGIIFLLVISAGYSFVSNNTESIEKNELSRSSIKDDNLIVSNEEKPIFLNIEKNRKESGVPDIEKKSNKSIDDNPNQTSDNSVVNISYRKNTNNNFDNKLDENKIPSGLSKPMREYLDSNKPNNGLLPGFSKESMSKLKKDNLQDTISINDLPPAIANSASKKLNFRNENGYDEVSERKANDVLSVVGRISGVDTPTPNLSFNLSLLPNIFSNTYQYLGYIYPYESEKAVLYSSVKRVFTHVENNSILVIEETSLENGSATLTTEFVNTSVLNCPAIIVNKKSSDSGQYGQINWNTRLIGYSIYQFNLEKNTDGLVQLANAIAEVNKNIHNCDNVSKIEKNLTPATVETPEKQ